MSYDILAFDPDSVTDVDFPAWWGVQSTWNEDHSYDDPKVTTASLRSFYYDLILIYPPIDGPGAPTVEELQRDVDLSTRRSSYSIGTSLIYGAFSWSQAARVRSIFTELAAKHGVAVAMVSNDGAILRP